MPAARSAVLRLAEKSNPDPDTGCIIWTGSMNRHGYGYLKIGRKNVMAQGAHERRRNRDRAPAGAGARLRAEVHRMNRLLLLTALLAGCDAETDALPIRVVTADAWPRHVDEPPADDVAALLDESVGYWVSDYEITHDSTRAVMTILLVDAVPESPLDGRTWRHDDCHWMVWSANNPWILTHELGHAFGLQHVEKGVEGNIMANSLGTIGDDLTYLQEETATRRIDHLRDCAAKKRKRR